MREITSTTTNSRAGRGGWTHEAPSATIDWYTPDYIFQALAVTFDLDPCSPRVQQVERARGSRLHPRR